MLGMGMTLTLEDFARIAKLPKAVGVGVLCQFTLMPFLGWSIAYGIKLHEIDPNLAFGLILVSCCPGGTASNVVAFLARANVALSVTMTMCSTFAAIAMTPLMTKWLAGAVVTVDAWLLFMNTLTVVLLPITVGILMNRYLPKVTKAVQPFSPFVSVVAIVLVVASIIGDKKEIIRSAGVALLMAPFLLHVGAFALGYLVARLIGFDEDVRRTISIEVGMQNSGLGAKLAKSHFPDSNAPVPCAISALYHCVIGSAVAAVWQRMNPPSSTSVEKVSVRPEAS